MAIKKTLRIEAYWDENNNSESAVIYLNDLVCHVTDSISKAFFALSYIDIDKKNGIISLQDVESVTKNIAPLEFERHPDCVKLAGDERFYFDIYIDKDHILITMHNDYTICRVWPDLNKFRCDIVRTHMEKGTLCF